MSPEFIQGPTALSPSDLDRIANVVAEAIGSPTPLLFDQVQARAFLGLSRTAWFRAKSADQIPLPVFVDGIEKWRRTDLEAWVARLKPGRRRTKRKAGPDQPAI